MQADHKLQFKQTISPPFSCQMQFKYESLLCFLPVRFGGIFYPTGQPKGFFLKRIKNKTKTKQKHKHDANLGFVLDHLSLQHFYSRLPIEGEAYFNCCMKVLS